MDLNLKSTYSFDVYPVAEIGNDFQNVTVLSILDPETAGLYIDIRAMHIRVFPRLPASTPDDPTSYNYVKLKTASGETRVIGMPWINQASIELVERSTTVFEVANTNVSDQIKIRQLLAANGFTALNMRTK
jgi:hypothetical protein